MVSQRFGMWFFNFQMDFIRGLGSKDAKSFVQHIYYRVFSNSLSRVCSWLGEQNTFRIKDLLITKLIKSK